MGHYLPADLDLMLSVARERENREYWKSYREAFLCTIFTNVYRAREKFPQPIPVTDFLPEYPQPEKKPKERIVMTDNEIEATLIKFVYPVLKAAQGGN